MYLVDLWTDEKLSLQKLHDDWLEFKKEDPVNHAETFILEFFQILDATLRGRNDYEIEGLTGAEVLRMYEKLITIC